MQKHKLLLSITCQLVRTGDVCGNGETCMDPVTNDACGPNTVSGCECSADEIDEGNRCDLYGETAAHTLSTLLRSTQAVW